MTNTRVIAALLITFASVSIAAQPETPMIPPSGDAPANRIIKYMLARYLDVDAAQIGTKAVAKAVDKTRTDQQLSAPSGAAGSTTVTERSGIAELLAIAIDRGAIAKAVSGTSVTLSTTPYAWLTAFGMRDSTDNWSRQRWARRVSLGSTFSSEDVTEGDFSSFETGEVKVVVHGSRSGRDFILAQANREASRNGAWQQINEIVRSINAADAAEYSNCTNVIFPKLGERAQAAFKALPPQSDTPDAQSLDHVFADYAPGPETLTALRQCAAALDLQARAEREALAHLKTIMDAYLADANRLQVSLAGLYQRDTTLSDFYTVKLLSDYNPARSAGADGSPTSFTANLNGQVDFNAHRRTAAATTLHQVRSWSVEGAANSPKYANRRYDWTLSLKGTREKDASARTNAVAQVRLNVHFTDTMTLPIGISYANRETDKIKKGYQVSIGVNALLDHLLDREDVR